MKRILLLLMCLFSSLVALCQDSGEDSTDSVYDQQMKSAVSQFKKRFGKFDEPYRIEYCVDTFKVEQQWRMERKRNSTDMGSAMIAQNKYNAYDKLLNKYYNKLLKVLDNNDRSTLIDAEKAWLLFKKQDEGLTSMVMSEKYFGGGSIQGVEELSLNMNMIKDRLQQIFSYYSIVGDRVASVKK